MYCPVRTPTIYEASASRSFWVGALQVLRSWRGNIRIIGVLTRREVFERYRGSLLGILWSFITPLLLMLIYTLVFSVVFRMQWSLEETGFGYFALMLYCGLIPFNFFSEVISKSSRLFVNSPNYVKKIAFPIEILPCVTAASALVHALISMGILTVGIALLIGKFQWTLLYLPVMWLPFVLCSLALSLFLATIGVFVRDIEHVVGLALSVLFFATPIFYSTARVPPSMHWILFVNPVAYAAANMRKIFVLGLPPTWSSWWALMAVGAALLLAVAGWFHLIRRRFADVV